MYVDFESDYILGECQPGLPDGIFTNKKSQLGSILEGLAMENVGIFYGNLVYFTAIWSIL
jgi:hypothetical protein